jgi:Tol biopolymer transport system component
MQTFSVYLTGRMTRRRLTTDAASDYDLCWSPDGTKIVFERYGYVYADGDLEIYIMDADGHNLVQMTDNSFHDRDANWSPDGGKIAFTTNQDGNYEIYVMNANGTGPTHLTDNLEIDLYPCW